MKSHCIRKLTSKHSVDIESGSEPFVSVESDYNLTYDSYILGAFRRKERPEHNTPISLIPT